MSEAHAMAGRIGGLSRVAREGGRKVAAPALAGFLAKFEREVDPDGRLAPAERKRRAEAARRAHMARLAMKSAAARRHSTPAQSVSSPTGTRAPAVSGGIDCGAAQVTPGEPPSFPSASQAAPHSRKNRRPGLDSQAPAERPPARGQKAG